MKGRKALYKDNHVVDGKKSLDSMLKLETMKKKKTPPHQMEIDGDL